MSDFEWDEVKRKRNVTKHALDFEAVYDFEWKTALTFPDVRKEYGEERWVALGFLKDTLHSCTYTIRDGNYRVISFRKASAKERKYYAQEHYD